ncbi:MAG: cytochrome oxidase subunit [Alphaproteobacteria bacterium]|nr:cytochrome oxidase subunit [Alphaproteobacteria bacterium]
MILLSEIPNTLIKKAAERNDLGAVKRWLMILIAMSFGLLVIRAFEFGSLRIWWYDNAYGSIVWTLLFLHLTHFLTDFVDTLVLAALIFTRHGGENRRMVDVAENAMYWRFVWLLWIPIYLMIYWVPRWMS